MKYLNVFLVRVLRTFRCNGEHSILRHFKVNKTLNSTIVSELLIINSLHRLMNMIALDHSASTMRWKFRSLSRKISRRTRLLFYPDMFI